MDEQDILVQMGQVSGLLEKISGGLKIDDWDYVEKLLIQVNEIQTRLKNSSTPVEIFLDRNPSFKKEYSALKEKLIEQIRQNNMAIKEWQEKQTAKIAGSRNILENIAKYYSHGSTSYYIDKSE